MVIMDSDGRILRMRNFCKSCPNRQDDGEECESSSPCLCDVEDVVLNDCPFLQAVGFSKDLAPEAPDLFLSEQEEEEAWTLLEV